MDNASELIDKEHATEFGENLRKFRTDKGLSQQALAKMLYVKKQAVSRWENGSRLPDLIMIRKIAQVLGVRPDTLLGYKKYQSDEEMQPFEDAEEPQPAAEPESFGESQTAFEPRLSEERIPDLKKTWNDSANTIIYVSIAICYSVSLLGLVLRIQSILPLSIEDTWVITIDVICQLLGLAGSSIGLFYSCNKKLSDKKIGVITSIFFVTRLIMDSFINIRGGQQLSAVAAILIIASILGIIATFMFYFTKRYLAQTGFFLCINSAWNVIRAMYTMIGTLFYARKYVTLDTSLSAILSICIYGGILYQVLIKLRRMYAADEADKKSVIKYVD